MISVDRVSRITSPINSDMIISCVPLATPPDGQEFAGIRPCSTGGVVISVL